MYGFLGHLVVHPQKDKILSYPVFILLSGPRMGGYFQFELVERKKKKEF